MLVLVKKITFCAAVIAACCVSPAWAEDWESAWIDQLGSSANDYGWSVATDQSGYTYLAGYTSGVLGDAGLGGYDAYLAKYDSAGTLVWTKQLGTDSGDYCYSVATDSSGYVYIAGKTYGSWDGVTTGGGYVAKYDSSGTLSWVQQTTAVETYRSVTVDSSGAVYVGGWDDASSTDGRDATVTKYDSSGSLQWSQLLGTTSTDQCWSVDTDSSGNVYIAGVTGGSLASSNSYGDDAFVAKYNSSGSLQWVKQIGSTSYCYEEGYGVAADANGDVYVVGTTSGSLDGQPQGWDNDAFVRKYSASGTELWTAQIGSDEDEKCYAVDVDSTGTVFISGWTRGTLGDESFGNDDVFIAAYDSDGAQTWMEQFGSSSGDNSYDICMDASRGALYLAGDTAGDLDGTNAGGQDAFLAKYEFTGTYPGDANHDGVVDISDLTVLSLNWEDYSEVKTWEQGNFNGDDYVDISDLTILSGNWTPGSSSFAEALASIGTVPEPTTFAMLIAGLVGLVAYAWRKR